MQYQELIIRKNKIKTQIINNEMRTYPISNPLEEKRVALEVLEDGRKEEEK